MRHFGRHDDDLRLCSSVAHSDEFSPKLCPFSPNCKKCHDLRQYLENGRRGDVEALGGKCPVFEAYGRCSSGWRCRFVKSHSREVEHADGRKELVLIHADNAAPAVANINDENEEQRLGVVNVIPLANKIALNRKKVDWTYSDPYLKWEQQSGSVLKNIKQARSDGKTDQVKELERSLWQDCPKLKPSEKRRLYFGPETPILAPLTTQGNLPFRRLCVDLGAQLTYSEMAMGLPLLQGVKGDWALMKAHECETKPPIFNNDRAKAFIFDGYDNSRDFRFGAQITATAPWIAIKAAEALSSNLSHLRLIDVNCGCPTDMIYKAGAGANLLENPMKLEKMIRGMNYVSGTVPITAKLRMGVRDGKPIAKQLIEKLAFGAPETRETLGAPGCAAITLHGRSRQQRYTRRADWSYIEECAEQVNAYHHRRDDLADTVREPDEASLPNGGTMYFIGNGDVYSHEDYYGHLESSRVNAVMVGRGALVKPWLFEEIAAGQYLDKSATERLEYVEKFCRYGLEAWGSDELGIGFTRRFLLEWLSFSHRYIPIGLLEYLPPSLNDRAPAWRGRNELETLLASDNYKDWIKISEMYLGPTHPGFTFQPKHKSNAYEVEG